MKTILAVMLAGSFLIAVPAKAADDKAPAGDAAKSGKKDKKADKGDKGKKDDGATKSGGGW